MYNNMYCNMYINRWMYFVTGLNLVLQQPSPATLAKTKAELELFMIRVFEVNLKLLAGLCIIPTTWTPK